MNVIDQFEARLPLAVGDNAVLQCLFLRHLFPSNYSLVNCRGLAEDHAGPPSYVKVAAEGFVLAAKGENGFAAGMDWLVGIPVPEDLPGHEMALLGIAVGLGRQSQAPWLEWWNALLHGLRATTEGRSLADLLAVAAGQQPPAQVAAPLDEYEVAQGLLCHPPQWDSAALTDYFRHVWKLPFPYHEDFFRGMLAVFILEQALRLAVKSPEELAAIAASARAEMHAAQEKALQQFAERRARKVVAFGALLGLGLMLTACGLLFVWHPSATDNRDRWDVLKWISLWLSGPLPALITLVRTLSFAVRRQPLQLDLQKLHRWYQAKLSQRWRTHLLSPLSKP
jgi:hypothetical protein